MNSERLPIRRAAVLGAGVMGAQIAAHLTAAGVETLLFDLPAREGDRNGIVLKAIAGLKKLSPSPLAHAALADALIPCNYEEHLDRLASADFVIEAVAERMDIKRALYRQIAPTSSPLRCSRAIPRGFRSPRSRESCPRSCARASAACISSIRRATCTSWS